EKERKTEGERPVGWPYFLSGELYGAGLCVMTAEWIIISLSLSLSLSLSPSLFLFFSANPFAVSESPSGRLSVSCKEAHPGRVLFSAKTCKAPYVSRFYHRIRARTSKSNVVYKISCNNCDASYVGQTGRQLNTRIAEHRNHIRHNTSVRSVITEKRLISEMLNIKKQKNSLNLQTEGLHEAYIPIVNKV
ncbi:hypothetical protein ALC56_05799, partial [Trachymyrmex septentrionalis]